MIILLRLKENQKWRLEMGNNALVRADEFKKELNEKHLKRVQNFFDGNEKKALKFMSAVVYSMSKTPKLQNCTKESLLQAFMCCAELGLYPSNVAGEAYVIPYGDTAQFQLGYQGIITLLYRSGNVMALYAEIIYEKDEFRCSLGTNQELVHEANLLGDRGDPVGAYAVAKLKSGERIFKVLPKETIFKFREKSQGYNRDLVKEKEHSKKKNKYPFKANSPWYPENDPDLMMWKKTAVKQLSKLLPKNSEIFDAIAKDTNNDVTSAFVDVDDVDNLTATEINNLYIEGKSIGLSQDEIKSIFLQAEVPEGFSTVTRKQAVAIKAAYEEKTVVSGQSQPEDDEVITERMASAEDIKALRSKAATNGLAFDDILIDQGKQIGDPMTENEFFDLSTMINDMIKDK
jgi:recombination protein RecT